MTMMKYGSTRGRGAALTCAEAIARGIAEDGGLFVPEALPQVDLDFIEGLMHLPYEQRAVKVLGLFLSDYTQAELKAAVARAYGGGKFAHAAVAPCRSVGDADVLELWHGPTSAFKDMALQLLPQLLSTALKKTGQKEEAVILAATSGDTGKAALEGFQDVAQTRIVVFYPQEGVSRIQKLQMVTQRGENAAVVAVEGNFDDAQSGVKAMFADAKLADALAARGYKLSSANSINWGRLAPQIVYYFSAYADLMRTRRIKAGESVHFAVPTGNFGNILAGYYAKRMGLPIERLICASNRNHILTDFFQTGVYDRNRPFYKTDSPSMDILISSNLERLLYHESGSAALVRASMEALRAAGRYEIAPALLLKLQETFWADWTGDAQAAETIRAVYEAHGYVLDPHTAVAWRAAQRYREETGDARRTVVVSTASPYKFSESVLRALGEAAEGDAFALLAALEAKSEEKAPEALTALKAAPVLHTARCGKHEMERALWSALGL